MKIKKYIAMIIIMALVVSLSVLSVSATTKPYNAGDADLDDRVTIKDATVIQKYVANIIPLSYLQECVSEVDGDGEITVKDATMVQKKCADIIMNFSVPGLIWADVEIKSLYGDYDSGKAMVGVPVTFTANATGNGAPFTFEFFINDKAVTEVSEINTFTHTFEEAGVYSIKAKVFNRFENSNYTVEYDYEVVEAYKEDIIKIKTFYHDNNATELSLKTKNITFTADAMFGSGKYEYAFYMDTELVQDYSEKNTYLMKEFTNTGTFRFIVNARDVATGEIASEEIVMDVGEPIPG